MTQQLSPLKNSPSLGLLKSQSLCVLPGAGGCWRSADLAVQGESLSRRFTSSNCSLREAVATSQHAGNTTSSQIHNGSSEDQLVHHVWSYFERESFLENEVYVATVIAVARVLQFKHFASV